MVCVSVWISRTACIFDWPVPCWGRAAAFQDVSLQVQSPHTLQTGNYSFTWASTHLRSILTQPLQPCGRETLLNSSHTRSTPLLSLTFQLLCDPPTAHTAFGYFCIWYIDNLGAVWAVWSPCLSMWEQKNANCFLPHVGHTCGRLSCWPLKFSLQYRD